MILSSDTVAILAGGLARRLYPLSETTPKSLIRVAGEPFIAHQLRLLSRQGFSRVVLCVGHLGTAIESFVGNGRSWGVEVVYSREPEGHLLGTGGALRHALAQCGDAFGIMYGDSYLLAPLMGAYTKFIASDKDGMMTVFRNEGRWDSSNVVYRNGAILEYSKTARHPGMRHIDYGFGALRAKTLADYPDGAAFDLAEVYGGLLGCGKLLGIEVSDRFYEIGSPAGLIEADRALGSLYRLAGNRENGA